MNKILIILLGLIFSYSYSQNLTDTENYVYKKTYLSDPSDAVQKQLEEVQYLDGLGRPKQVISVKSTPSGQDMVLPIVYDQFGRKTKDYLPVPVQTSNAGIQTSVNESTVNSYYGVTNAFSEKELESSPLSRMFQSANPGEEWKMSSGHTVKYSYDANSTADQVKKYQITTTWDNANQIYNSTLSETVLYDENSLYKFSIKDEDNNEKIVFKDLYGHIILIRKNDGTHNIDTYYVYDSNDHLAYVIPPLASASSSLTTTMLDNLCYQYRYDNKNRLVEKKIPGRGLEYLVYDKKNRLVLSQDAVLRTVNNNFTKRGWLFTKYDQFGRIVYSGFFANTASRTAMQTALNNMASWNNESRSNTPFTLNGMDVFYTKDAFPTGSMTILGVSYYDTYPPLPTGVSIPSYVITPTQSVLTQDAQNSSRSTKSLPTASYVKNVEDDNWSKDFIWYDTKGRVIGTHSVNHLGGYTKTEAELDFSGTPKKTNIYHLRRLGENGVTVKERYVYDAQNRVKQHYHQVDNKQEELLTENTYNELSDLINKKVGNNLQSIDYTYNIRGWLTAVNKDQMTVSDLGGKLFSYKIKYTQKDGITNPDTVLFPDRNVKPKYNGNIAEVDWRAVTNLGNIPSPTPKRYGYAYDGLNRLKAGYYQNPDNPWSKEHTESLDYDLNGNITNLYRTSLKENNNTFATVIDSLEYIYSGNNVINIKDHANNPTGYEGGGGEIKYDLNGNMWKMADKNISKIQYNYLNLPTQFEYGDMGIMGMFKHLYRADGTKLQKSAIRFECGIINCYGITDTTDYLDGFQYMRTVMSNNGGGGETEILQRSFSQETEKAMEIQAFSVEERKTIPPTKTPDLRFFPTAEGFYDYQNDQYIYQYKDQLGNARISFARNNLGALEITDVNDYYPFGMNHLGTGNAFFGKGIYKNYKFQEQELQETGFYSYKWRNYMPDVGRFFNVDPLSEAYAYQSHYNFSENRVIDAREIEGLEAQTVNNTGFNGGHYEGGINVNDGSSTLMKDSGGNTIGADIAIIDLGTFSASTFTSGIGRGFTDTFKGIGNFISSPIDGISNAVSNYTWNDYGNSMLNSFSFGLYGQINGITSFGNNLYDGNNYDAGYQTGEAVAGATIALATEGAGRGMGKLAGSGPVAGVIEVSERVKSVGRFKNYFPKSYIEFVFDTETNSFAVGKPHTPQPFTSPHESLANALESGSAGNKKYVGGMFERKGNTIFTNENSGHYGWNWTNENRAQFIKYMENKTGIKINHQAWTD
ncbi:DUF6443 domain-containing protein [Chryseobacterium luteum]|uniref:DUF6443 domain-containing protein n=1 Tax=Chryseobacterium luteum TaxID=421531 RepID=UPI0006914AC4|nr:DUF6443 domain-containing protein [Chryseobacterium luteum]